MQWNSLDDFLAMGGYGLYVWASFGTTALCLMVEVAAVRRRYRLGCQAVRAGQQSDTEPG
ncbi:MAG TPA: heme exporter protein CcmD [Nitrospiraceae bacterium]